MTTGDRIVVAVYNLLVPAHVMIVYEDAGMFTARLISESMIYKNRVALRFEDEGIMWMRGESPPDADGPFLVAAALSGEHVELF